MRGTSDEVETEVKFLGPDLDALRGRLKDAGAKLGSPRSLERNTVFDDSAATLRSTGRLLRVRDDREVTVKLPLEDARFKSRTELTVKLESGDIVRLLAGLGFHPSWRYEKQREGWDLDGMWITLDELPFVGAVVEIEGPGERIDETADRLGLSDTPRSVGSYRDLYEDYVSRTGIPPGDMTFDAEREAGSG